MASSPEIPWIVMRSCNDREVIECTLKALFAQTHPFNLIVLDNRSTDGTRECVKSYTQHIVDINNYISGDVLNRGMEHTSGEFVVFLNSDCTPVDEHWLENLLTGFSHKHVAAVFGRQIPRKGCKPLYAKDTEDTYGDGHRQAYWRNSFSMASSAIRRSVWEELKFDNRLWIAEDNDWTWRARHAGFSVNYVKDAVVLHSHNYTLREFYRRQFKEGRDEALIYNLSRWERSFLRYSVLPLLRQVLSDWNYAATTKSIFAIPHSPLLRCTQMVARRRGFLLGERQKAKVYSNVSIASHDDTTPRRGSSRDF